MTPCPQGVLAVTLGLIPLGVMAAASAEETASLTYLCDLSHCTPAAALSDGPREGHWQLIPYETVDPAAPRGTMVGAASYTQAPDITLPLDVSGWHAIYVGYWNPHHAYDGGTTVKVKLSDDPCFSRIREGDPDLVYDATYIKEAFFKCADLTGRDLAFGKVNGPLGEKIYIAYVKLVPMSAEEVAALQQERARTDTRTMEGSIDGISYFWGNEYRAKEHILELVEPYRYSDVAKIIWAVNYGDVTNYPSQIGTLRDTDPADPIVYATHPYTMGQKVCDEALRGLLAKGIVPEEVAAAQLHAMGLKFDIMFRLTIAGFDELPPRRRAGPPTGFLATHPQFRMALADGTLVEKASYAYPQVRGFMLSLIEEAAGMFDVDGVNLCFIRGPQFARYDKPVLDEFRRRYGEDGTKVGLDDPRMRAIRSSYPTRFLRDARRVLDEVGGRKGKRIELSAWVYESLQRNLGSGLDVLTWINEGYLDSIMLGQECQPEPNDTLVKAAAAKGCRLASAIWDIDTDSTDARAAHIPEVRKYAQDVSVQLKTIGGIDVGQGLCETAYSGG